MKRIVLLLVLALGVCGGLCAGEAARPNIIFILCDDLGIGDVGVFFQNARRDANKRSEPFHSTPNIDTLAAEGIQLRHHYCPASVCAPSRASLLLGVHQGHANVRDNQFDKALENNHTLASVLKAGGYATACVGKWGLQGKADPAAPNGFPAHPMNRGFDYYFGYISHNAGHMHYPKEDGEKLYDGAKDVAADYAKCYTTDLFTARSKKWIADQHAAKPDQPFFLYLAYDTPHAKLQLPPCAFPAEGVKWLGTPGKMINTATGTVDSFIHPDYASATWDHDNDPKTPEHAWPDVYKRYATDVRRIDDCVGDLMRFLKELKLDENTMVVFTSDNGPSIESYLKEPYAPTFFSSFGPHDGIKRDLWEGGIRVGAIARWPGKIPAKQVSASPSAFWDWMPTFAEVAGVATPARSDGVSLWPTLKGEQGQTPSRLYIEYFVGGKTPDFGRFAPGHRARVRQQMQAIRIGDYMGVRYAVKSHSDAFEIYDAVKDPQEKENLAGKPEMAALQQEMKDTVLWVRRPNESAPRPYDGQAMPALKDVKATPGISWWAFKGPFEWAAKFDLKTAVGSGLAETFGAAGDQAGVMYSGLIEVPAEGEYTFFVETNGSALLRIHEATVVDLGFKRGDGNETQGTVKLTAGKHPIHVWVAGEGGKTPSLAVFWKSGNGEKTAIPAGALSH